MSTAPSAQELPILRQVARQELDLASVREHPEFIRLFGRSGTV